VSFLLSEPNIFSYRPADDSSSHHETQTQPFDLPKSCTFLAGLGIGLLAASALSLSTSLPELALAGSESVRVAFRLGVHVDSVSQSLEARESDGTLSSWAYVVTGLAQSDIQKELDRFNSETVCLIPSTLCLIPPPDTDVRLLLRPTQSSPKCLSARPTRAPSA
jgi:hypothetical protein